MLHKGSLAHICKIFEMKKKLCQKLEKNKVWIEITMSGHFLSIFVVFP